MLGRARLGLVLGLLTALPAAAQDLQKGTAAYARGDYATALLEIGPLAEAGHARAQNNLALMFHRGHGVPKDGAQAATWFRKAAEQAHASAQCNLAVMYLKGDGVPQDYGEAIFWFREAAEQGHPRAQYNLAVMYLKGDGVPRDPVRSMAWFREAAALGHAGAGKALALFPSERPDRTKTEGPEKRAGEASQLAARGAFRIQLGAIRSQTVAAREADRLNRVHGAVLGEVRVVPVRADLGERGVFWRLRAGSFNDRAAATALCSRLAERNQACIVVKG